MNQLKFDQFEFINYFYFLLNRSLEYSRRIRSLHANVRCYLKIHHDSMPQKSLGQWENLTAECPCVISTRFYLPLQSFKCFKHACFRTDLRCNSAVWKMPKYSCPLPSTLKSDKYGYEQITVHVIATIFF